jgi:hypothetical protein
LDDHLVAVDGHPDLASSGIEEVGIEYFILRTGAAYIVGFATAPQYSKRISPTFEEIIKSFRVTA